MLGLGSLHRALSAYRSFFNGHRPHQGIADQTPDRLANEVLDLALTREEPAQRLAVECEAFLGGLLNSYYHKAA